MLGLSEGTKVVLEVVGCKVYDVGLDVGLLVSTLVGGKVRLSSELEASGEVTCVVVGASKEVNGASVSVERLIVGLSLVCNAEGLLLGPGIGEYWNKQDSKYEQLIDKKS